MSHHNAHWQKVKSGEKSIKAVCKLSPLTLFLVFLVSKPAHTDAHPDTNISLILFILILFIFLEIFQFVLDF